MKHILFKRISFYTHFGRIALILVVIGLVTACQPLQRTLVITSPVEVTSFTPTLPVPSASVTATKTATPTSQAAQDLQPTQATLDVDKEATAQAIALIHKELPVYNASPSYGHVGAIYEPISLTADGYHASQSSNKEGDPVIKDFLLAADITWDSEYGNAGCGFTFRSDNNQNAPDEYRVVLSRISGGRIDFYALAKGKIANTRVFYAIPYDPSFKWESGTTNRLTLGVKDNNVYIFSNTIWVGALNITDPPPEEPILPEKPVKPAPPSSDLTGKDLKEAQSAYKQAMKEYQKEYDKYSEAVNKIYADYNAMMTAYSSNDIVYNDGSVGLLAYATSGSVDCHFSNAWLWVLE